MNRLRPTEEDAIARDVLGALLRISARSLYQPPRRPPTLAICGACGALERADRPCQVCAATRRAVA